MRGMGAPEETRSFGQGLAGLLRRRWVSRVLTIVLLLIVILTMVRTIGRSRDGLSAWLHRLTPLVLLRAFVAYSVAFGLGGIVWFAMMARLSNVRNLATHFRIYAITGLARRIPGLPWHVVGRAYLYDRMGVPKSLVLVASGMEQILVVLSGVWIYFVAVVLTRQQEVLDWLWLGVSLLGGVLLVNPYTVNWLLRRLRHVEVQRLREKDLLLWTALYALTWIVGSLTMWPLVGAVEQLPLSAIGVLVGAWSLSGALSSLAVFLPSGLGIRELGLTLLLAPLVSPSAAAFVALALRVLTMSFEFVWGAIAWLGSLFHPTGLRGG